jgi:hypothetical protein
MVKHIILWNFKEELTPQQRQENAMKIKQGLEGLKDKIEGIVCIEVITNHLESSNAEIMLDSTFIDEQALKNYQVHAEHVHCATNIVRPVVCNRMCIDYELSK